MALSSIGEQPSDCPEIVPAWWRLLSTYESVSGLFNAVHLVRQGQLAGDTLTGASDRLSTDTQDLLRAAIVFTSAGLDASIASLLKNGAPILATYHGTARGKFERYLENQANAPKITEEFRLALIDLDPRPKLLELYVVGLTIASFQGSSDIRNRASSALGVSNQQIPKARFTALDPFFTARNDVAHRLDLVEPETVDAKPSRRPRGDDEVRKMCDQALLLVRDLIRATAENIVACARFSAKGS